jgi:hypothetical protein
LSLVDFDRRRVKGCPQVMICHFSIVVCFNDLYIIHLYEHQNLIVVLWSSNFPPQAIFESDFAETRASNSDLDQW